MTDEDKKKYEDAVKTLMSAVNGYNDQDIGQIIADQVMHHHPTLQQSFMRCIVKFMSEYSKHEYIDLRNEGASKLAKAFVDWYLSSNYGLPMY
jgi:phage gp36-like protein